MFLSLLLSPLLFSLMISFRKLFKTFSSKSGMFRLTGILVLRFSCFDPPLWSILSIKYFFSLCLSSILSLSTLSILSLCAPLSSLNMPWSPSLSSTTTSVRLCSKLSLFKLPRVIPKLPCLIPTLLRLIPETP